jgi:uncharacterized membrane-anchored protein YhcB (DUF1043 family)
MDCGEPVVETEMKAEQERFEKYLEHLKKHFPDNWEDML